MKKLNLSSFLKNKTRAYSAQAAVTTIVVHLLLIGFAGSIVVVHYVQKRNAELIAHTEAKPKLERKKLQAPVARVEQLQQKALTSKLVSKKVSFSNPKFVLPDTGRISSVKTQKLSLPGADSGRVLKNLSRVPGIGPSRVNFFGVRVESEKVVFVIDASAAMLEARTGGPATYEYIRAELAKIVSEMKPAMLFNLVFYDQQRVFMFRPNLVPASRETAAQLAEWLKAVNGDPAQAGLSAGQNNYKARAVYETAVGSDAQGWLLALQASMEQQPDTVMVLGTGWGHHHISQEKANRLLDFAMWELVTDNTVSGAPALAPDRKLRDDLLKGAVTTIQQEEKLRAAKKLPAGFVRNVAQYVEYSKEQVLDHLEAVYKAAYTAHGLSRPDLYYVCLTEANNQVVAGGTVQHLWALTGRYNGKVDFLRREPPPAGIAKGSVQQTAESTPAESAAVAALPVTFFNVQASGSRIAFILDASPGMLAEETGGAASYNFIKEQLQKAIGELQEGLEFNVILYNGRQLALFKPQMVPALPENIAAAKEWLQSVNSDPARPGIPDSIVSTASVRSYNTAIGSDASGWLLATQTAIGQQADAVFITGSGWGDHPMGRDKGRQLLDFSIWESWSSGGAEPEAEDGSAGTKTTAAAKGSSAIGTTSGMQQDKRQRDALLKEAFKAIEKEDQQRKAKGLPPPFIRDIISYFRYTAPQVNEHLNAVVQAECASSGTVIKPAINFICLVPAQSGVGGGDATKGLRKLTGDYGGSFVPFRGAASNEEMKKLNPNLDSLDWSVPEKQP